MTHPLDYLKFKKAFNLLCEFYSANSKISGKADLGKLLKESINKSPEELKEALLNYFSETKKSDFRTSEIDPWSLFNFSDSKVFMDYGTNNLRHINSIGRKYKNIERLIAVDVISQCENFEDKSRGNYFQVDPISPSILMDDNSLDVVVTKFVLHHFESEDAIKKALSEFSRLLKKGGRYLLWEETFTEQNPNHQIIKSSNDLGILTDESFTKKFYELSEEERFAFIILNDWVINLKYEHMQWTYQYKTVEQWVELVESFGFELKKEYNLGLRLNGLMKQGAHVVMEFERV